MTRTAAGLVLAASIAGLATPAFAECLCRARGLVASEGQTVCITTPTGRKLARCEKAQNVTTWRFLQESCPSASNSSETGKTPGALALSR